jgi:hypothetical protein
LGSFPDAIRHSYFIAIVYTYKGHQIFLFQKGRLLIVSLVYLVRPVFCTLLEAKGHTRPHSV